MLDPLTSPLIKREVCLVNEEGGSPSPRCQVVLTSDHSPDGLVGITVSEVRSLDTSGDINIELQSL